MATRILDLPIIKLAVTVGSNEDWRDTLAFFEQDNTTPLPLTDIAFSMDIRTGVQAFVRASTENSMLRVGGDDDNQLAFVVPASLMARVPGAQYPFDIVAKAEGVTRRFATGTLTVEAGVTR